MAFDILQRKGSCLKYKPFYRQIHIVTSNVATLKVQVRYIGLDRLTHDSQIVTNQPHHHYHASDDAKKKVIKNIQQRGFASGHPPNY